MKLEKKLVFIFNPKAGKGKIKTSLMDIVDIFNKGGYEVIIRATQAPKDAYEQVKKYADKVDLIVCSGGDGTLDEVAGAAGSMVYAYLIDRQETVNRIKIVENKTHIEEEFDPPADPGPGSVIKKKPCIVNDSVIQVYVRVRVVFSNLDAQAQCEPIKIKDSWKTGEDGYYYYQKQLQPGQRTDTVFDNIVIKNIVKKEDLVPFDILVYEESVQSEGFSSPEEAFARL